jgi:hypothetical protein
VLAGVDEDGLDPRLLQHLADERGDLGEIRPRADDVDDPETVAHWLDGSTGDEYNGLRVDM